MTARAAAHETHVGVVVLVGDRAYKLKKPVRTAFLDFGSLDRRRRALARELELNRRLAPDVYLGISELTPPREPGEIRDDAGGEPLLVMRRMPDERRLATLVRDGADVKPALRDVARLMAAFHAGAERGSAISADGGRDALAARWAANVAELAPFRDRVLAAALVDDLARLSRRFLAGRGPLLADRVLSGRIVDGHGDLIADDVFCLDDGPRVLDCLEFDDRLRHVDGLDDVAFLAMDLERLGRPDLAAAFLDTYAEFSGDPAPAALRHHYVAYRAVVRAKVACLRHDQGDPAAAAVAERNATIALDHLRAGAVRLALVGGLPGTGKSTLAAALADRFGAVVLSSDRVRKELAGIDPEVSAAAPFGHGLYAPDRVDAVYAALLRRAGELLGRGESVVLDASWTHDRHRRGAGELAERTHSELVALECRAPREVAAGRIAARGATASDATAAVAAAMDRIADAWPDAQAVSTDRALHCSLESAAKAWERAADGRVPVRAPG